MSPFHRWASTHHMHYYRGPSRFIWFVIGAAAATWYHIRAPEFRREWEHCKGVRVLPPPPVPMKEGETDEERWQRGAYRSDRAESHPHQRFPPWSRDRHRNTEPVPPPMVEVQANSNVPVQQPQPQAPPPPPEPVSPTWPWDSQAADDMVSEMSKRASQTLTELSATLQSFNAVSKSLPSGKRRGKRWRGGARRSD
ncbi:hypothetical protein FA13DRAFT_1726859 [Coprinellus micaceus]|uniref:Uncharacterized protein n=1 Tax=Coprinellus micaceus TaxID=71717 RepID=A0A4Y7TQN8_COPMI|nr:hypothetical protein FA13DRAFT_1726859 [Coprinellus micaceus]